MRYLLLLLFLCVGCGETPAPDATQVCDTVCEPLVGTPFEGLCAEQCDTLAGHVIGEVSAALCAKCHPEGAKTWNR